MEIKKSPKANLENKKFLFMEIGLIAALLMVLGAFEWSTTETTVSILEEETAVVIEEEQVPITQEEQLPPPEVPKEPVMSDVIDIVDDDIKVEDNFLISTEDDKSLGVEIKDYVVEQQEEEVVEEEEIPFAIVEQKPTFQGKDPNHFTKWVFSKIVYPEIAKENGVQGRVTLQFTIDTDGSIRNVKVLRGVDSSLDKEAVRVVSSSPKWQPGMQRNKPVKVKYTFPVVFQLR
jgi:protein TonB